MWWGSSCHVFICYLCVFFFCVCEISVKVFCPFFKLACLFLLLSFKSSLFILDNEFLAGPAQSQVPPPGQPSLTDRPSNHSPAMTAKSASTSQAMTSPFRMWRFTASLTLPIPSSLPPSPTPGGKGNWVSIQNQVKWGWLWGNPFTRASLPQGGERGWLSLYFQTTRRCCTFASSILETSLVKNECGYIPYWVMFSITDGMPSLLTRVWWHSGLPVLSWVAPAQGGAASLWAAFCWPGGIPLVEKKWYGFLKSILSFPLKASV